MPLDEIEDIISHNQDVIVIVDEAYVDFGGHSAQELLQIRESLSCADIFQVPFHGRNAYRLRNGFFRINQSFK